MGFLLVWVLTETIYFVLAKQFFSKVPAGILNHFINRLGGALPAILNALVFWAFLLTLFVGLPIPANLKSAIFGSEIGSFLVSKAAQFEKPLAAVFSPAVTDIQKSLTFLTVVPESRQQVDLNFQQKEFKIDPVSETKMFELVNLERANRGLRVLVLDTAVRDVGRAHSRDMFQRGYFSHYSPEGEDVGDRLKNAEISFFTLKHLLNLHKDIYLHDINYKY